MGSSHSSFPKRRPYFHAIIRTNDNKIFEFTSQGLVDHILLLREVIKHPEMTQKGETLTYFIEDYCRRMADQKMQRKHQQQRLPWRIDWIWHVHRLHPIAYNNDCTQQLPDGKLVDKNSIGLRTRLLEKFHSKISSKPVKSHSTFVPSIDLVSAVLRQCCFLEKFKQHPLFTMNWYQMDQESFEKMMQNYVSFMKLAKRNQLIVPTFEIDLIWHTHMRYPESYQTVSKALCGFLLHHDDSIEEDILKNAYQQTADRWKSTYQIDYGTNIHKDNLQKSQYISSCALIYTSVISPPVGGICGGGGGGCGGGCGG